MTRATVLMVTGAVLCAPLTSRAQKVFLNPSDQYENAVAGGGNEAQYAKINAELTAAILLDAGFQVVVDQDFYNAPKNANSWGADIFVSIHSNAGGGHGTETLYASNGGKVLASHVQTGLLAHLPYQDRGLKYRTDLYVLNKTTMYAVLAEVVFHDCAKQTGYQGHPPSESAFLKSASGQQAIAAGLASGICSYFGWSCDDGVIIPPVPKGWFKGVVYRAPDMNDRIPGALVVLNTGQKTTASATGYWEFELDPGTYTATAYAEGYQPNSSTRVVVAGQEVWGSIGLTPATVQPEPKPEPSPDSGPNGAELDALLADSSEDITEVPGEAPDLGSAIAEESPSSDGTTLSDPGAERPVEDQDNVPGDSTPKDTSASGTADSTEAVDPSSSTDAKVFSSGGCRSQDVDSKTAIWIILPFVPLLFWRTRGDGRTAMRSTRRGR